MGFVSRENKKLERRLVLVHHYLHWHLQSGTTIKKSVPIFLLKSEGL